MNNLCVCCGQIIPEGRQVCKVCENSCNYLRGYERYAKIKKKIFIFSGYKQR